jgi:photosystem II stability/assembly factor-like uncharacterized protein
MEAQQLLARGIGWFFGYQGKLYWTRDDGVRWTDITPDATRPLHRNDRPAWLRNLPVAAASSAGPKRRNGELLRVFFRNKTEGWAVLGGLGQDEGFGDYQLAHTVDSGDHWSVIDLHYPRLPESWQSTLVGPSGLYFVDALHGWMMMSFSGNSRPGRLLMTEDGGKSWQWTNGPGESGEMMFLSVKRGWVACYAWSEKVFQTDDGGKNWSPVSLQQPPATEGVEPRVVRAPQFTDSRHGILPVVYAFPPERPAELAIYKTSDAGDHWQLARVLILSEGSGAPPIAVDGRHFLMVKTNSGTDWAAIERVAIDVDGAPGSDTPVLPSSPRGIGALWMVDKKHAWLLRYSGLLSTEDGGRTWREITPGPKPPPTNGVLVRNGVVVRH